MKCLCLFVLWIMMFSCLVEIQTLESERKKTLEELLGVKGNHKHGKKLKIPRGPVMWEGWVKFIYYTNSESPDRPKNFFQNNHFFHQKVLKSEFKSKDNKGSLNVPSRFHFFGKLMKDQFNFLSTRRISITKNFATFDISSILPIDESNKFHSSIRDLGNFAEGNCLQVFTKVPASYNPNFDPKVDNSNSVNWLICFEKPKVRDSVMGILINQKLLQQQKEKKAKDSKPAQSLAELTKKMPSGPVLEKQKNASPKDGYWVLLQDWSQCSLKCGGGKSVQHWMCVPPKQGGKPCLGKAIREKKCNTQPCPGQSSLTDGNSVKSELNVVAKPIIKSLPFSSRPQNYMKCVVKENDVFYLTWKEGVSHKTTPDKYPSRIVMNNRTISLFNDDTYDSAVVTYDLNAVEVGTYEADSCCFTLSAGTKSTVVCGGFGTSCGNLTNPTFFKEWSYDINFFKTKCHVQLQEFNWKKKMAQKAAEDAANQAGMDNMAEREKMINKKLQEKKNMEWQKKIANTQNLALKAIKREINIEKLLQKEVQLKTELEANNLLETKKREEKKKECLDKALKDREIQDQRMRDNKQAELQLEKIKEEAKKEVENKRLALRSRIQDIIKKSARRKRIIEQEINVIRGQMATNLLQANRAGDQLKCKNASNIPEKINLYCNQNIVDDYNKNIECKDPSSFCYICCETEFGNLVLDKRDKCKAMCDELAKKDLDTGDFLWSSK